jgi:methylglutaconyl-CoA hydratase
MLDELTHCFRFLNKSKKIRVVVLRGKGKSFSSGADLQWMVQSGISSYKKNEADSFAMAVCLRTIYKCTKPTIAVAHGAAIGGGIGLLCACDFAVAEANSVFSLSELRVGLVPSTIMPYILIKMNQHKVKMLMFTGKKISATEAISLGLVELMFEKPEIDDNLKLIVHDIMKSSPGAIKESKELIGYLNRKVISDKILSKTVKSITEMKMSNESKEGIAAYHEKRLPKWAIKE